MSMKKYGYALCLLAIASLAASGQGFTPPKLPLPTLPKPDKPLEVTGLAPAGAARGARITLTGENFLKRPELYVFFPDAGGTPSQSAEIVKQTDTALEVIVPPLAESGRLTVVSLGEDDAEEVAAPAFTVLKTPAIKDLTRTVGAPGMRLFITGYNIEPEAKPTVEFGGGKTAEIVSAGPYMDKGNREIDPPGPVFLLEVKIPTGAITGPVTVSTVHGSAATSWNFQVVTKAPTAKSGVFQVERIVPERAERGARVTIYGKGFLKRPELYVRFANSTGTPNQSGRIVAKTDTAVEVIVPPFAESGKIEITSFNGIDPRDFEDALIAGFTVDKPPAIGEFTPGFGRPGDRILIKGWNIGAEEAPVVKFAGGKTAAIQAINYSGELTEKGPVDAVVVAVPEGAVTGPVTVLTPNGSFTTLRKFILRAAATSKKPPRIDGFTPDSGGIGSEITLTGEFDPDRLNNKVRFRGAGEVYPSFCDGKTLKVKVPAGSLTGPIVIQTPAGEAKSARSFYLPPQIAKLSAYQGPVGYVIKIYGWNFDLDDKEANLVKFGGAVAAVLKAAAAYDADILEVEVPPEAVSGPVTVSTPGGTAASPEDFTVLR